MKKLSKDVLTTGEVAKICNVSLRTVIKWFDKGYLKGYIIPGTKDRRIPRSELVDFMKANKMPIRPLEQVNKGELMEYCWEYFERINPDFKAEDCENCIIFDSHTLGCYTLVGRLKTRGTSCSAICEECEYYHNVWQSNGKYDEGVPSKIPCWEYYREKDGCNEKCLNCPVFKARAVKCFEYSRMMQPMVCCRNMLCSQCGYFQYTSALLNRESSVD